MVRARTAFGHAFSKLFRICTYVTAETKQLSQPLSPLESALTKNRGWGGKLQVRLIASRFQGVATRRNREWVLGLLQFLRQLQRPSDSICLAAHLRRKGHLVVQPQNRQSQKLYLVVRPQHTVLVHVHVKDLVQALEATHMHGIRS